MPIAIILDQFNVISNTSGERSGFNNFLSIIKSDIELINEKSKKSKKKELIYIYNPIILISQKLDTNIKKLLKYSDHIHLNNTPKLDIELGLQKIIKNENIKISKTELIC